MTNASPTGGYAASAAGRARSLRLRIINVSSGQVKVALTLPVSLVSVAQRLGARLLPPNGSIEALTTQAEHHGSAHLEWIDPAHDERIELTLE
ncbi:MAG TPA: hypothetical protein VFZ66_19755 [Herpetosiphonaceae bacterium]